MNENPEFLPLRGTNVVELAQNLAGPYCGQILAALGADVIKVEPPGSGDAARGWGPPFVAGTGSIFAAANRGKRSVTADITTADGRQLVRALCERADILIEAFRPGRFAEMGYDHETVSGWNPRLIYCSVLAYGETGPLRSLPGYDPLMQAHSGLMSITGHGGTGPARVGTSVIDMGTGMWLSVAVLAALRQRDVTGSGTRLSVSLYDTALAWNAYHLAAWVDSSFEPGLMGTELPMIVPYGAFPTSDGGLMIAAANDNLFFRLCEALELKELLADERLRSNSGRVRHREHVNARLAGATVRFPAVALLELLRSAGVPSAPIRSVAEAATDPQTLASGMMVRTEDGSTALPLPLRYGGVRPSAGSAPPAAGEHTDAVRRELGLGEAGGQAPALP